MFTLINTKFYASIHKQSYTHFSKEPAARSRRVLKNEWVTILYGMITMKHILHNWTSPNVYSGNYGHPPEVSGVYAIIITDLGHDSDDCGVRELVYIGSAKNLKNRLCSHEVIKVARALLPDFHIGTFFKEFKNHKKVEKKLIKHFAPKINQHYV